MTVLNPLNKKKRRWGRSTKSYGMPWKEIH